MPLKDPEARREYNKKRYLEVREERARQAAERYKNDPEFAEAARKRAKDWYETNKERAAEWGRKYRSDGTTKQRRDAANQVWRKRNPDKRRAHARKHYEKHKEQKSAYRKKYAAANRAKISQKNAEYYQRNKEKIRAYSKKWWSDNPLFARMYSHERRAREATVGGKYTIEEAHELWLRYEGKCAVEDCDKTPEYCVDHVIPLSRGGTNESANLQILCKSHNSQKKNRTNEEWTALFNVRLRKVSLLTASPLLRARARAR